MAFTMDNPFRLSRNSKYIGSEIFMGAVQLTLKA
jgi:hypothetical protein